MDIIQRIKQLTQERSWSEYRLGKASGLAASTVSNIFHRDTIPSIPTLEVLCETFGITLSQFFGEGEEICLSEEQRQLLDKWASISPEQREILFRLLETMGSNGKNNKKRLEEIENGRN